MNTEERLTLLEKQIRMLEEEVCYCHKDLANLTNIIENIKPEVHTHYTMITENVTCMDCQLNDLNDIT
jgi:hypothetical protein